MPVSGSAAGSFLAGLNTLDFIVNNGGGPTALRVEMTGNAAPAPEPETWLLFPCGLAGLLVVNVRRRQRADKQQPSGGW